MIDFCAFADELTKIAVARFLLHPAVLGAGLGGAGSALASDKGSRLEGAAKGAAIGAAIGTGVRYLPGAIRKAKMLKQLHPYAGDIGWMAPSLLAAPAIAQGMKGRKKEKAV